MKCTHTACVGNRAYGLPGLDTTCYATGALVSAGGRHFRLGQAHWEHYGTNDAALNVRWEAEEVASIDPALTRARD